MTTSRQERIETLREKIIRASINASMDLRNVSKQGEQMMLAHNAINHRTVLLKYPEIAAYWARRR